MSLMRTLCLLLSLVLPAPALAGEALPESSPGNIDETDTMEGRFSAPAMGAQELESLYLQSPIELDNTEEEGLRSVTDQDRYTETDLLQRERLQSSRSNSPQAPTRYERPPLPIPSATTPKPL